MNDIKLIDYQELLSQLEEHKSNHLLLGNGFNNSLGIKTNYEEIFSRMKKEYSDYEKVEEDISASFDIEKLIGDLKKQVESNENDFLTNYIERKVKTDFMKATNEIVQESIKKVYQKKIEGIYLLFKNFTNYFTLNYDPFLYLLLLKFKKEDSLQNSSSAVALQHKYSFIAEDLNNKQNEIYTKIKHARDFGFLLVDVDDILKTVDLKITKKPQFISSVKTYFQDEGWDSNDITKVCDQIWKEENNKPELHINDGFQLKLFNPTLPQNLYFLHGAFHIIKGKDDIQKIEAKRNKTFCERLEEAIHNEDKGIICILTDQSKEKKTQINNNNYLKKCFDDLSKIKGSLVILGSSLAENDKHIFDQINKSEIDQIYISSCEQEKDKDFKNASNLFGGKKVTLFDYNTISYKKGDSK